MGNYRNIIDRQALNVVRKNPDIPDYHLMVGQAEQLAPLPILVYQDYMTAEVAKMLPKTADMTAEEVQRKLKTGELTIDDFFQNVYPLGNPIE